MICKRKYDRKRLHITKKNNKYLPMKSPLTTLQTNTNED